MKQSQWEKEKREIQKWAFFKALKATGIVILGVLLIGCVYYLLFPPNFQYDKFAITQNVCWNETNEYSYFSNSGCWLGCNEAFILQDATKENILLWIKCTDFCDEVLNYTYQKCGTKEVNEIKMCWFVSEGRNDCRIIISKKDLTTDWLDENCECQDYCRERGGQTQCPLNEEAKDRGNYKCRAWKCNEYEVRQ